MTNVLLHINELLVASVLIVTFSLLAYISFQNWRNEIARSFCVLLACVLVVYGGDALLVRAVRPGTTQFLLRAQWLGIAVVPAAYLHLSQALLITSLGIKRSWRGRWPIGLAYVGSMLFFALALSTDLVVRGGIASGALAQFGAGPFFWLYVLYFITSTLLMFRAVVRSRRNALTPTLRRRMTYLGISFVAPGLGVFPYLVIAGSARPLPETVLLLLSALVNVGVMFMITVMAYSVAFHGMLLPDRLIKQDFIRWGLYGPVVGVTIILCLQSIPWFERAFGLPSDTLITFAVMIMTVIMPMVIGRIRRISMP